MKEMKEIRAIVRPNRLPLLREALRGIPNFPGLTLMKAEGFTAPASVGLDGADCQHAPHSQRLGHAGRRVSPAAPALTSCHCGGPV